ncbi:winged helix-turn-helix transcriptional regulator [Listeria booriae]|uniref:winged helix-turn-helix transcriptional regulator n=1 Tax=Listeria booriae TaxID=1552123 RepID=UPI0016253E24|nr:helix-turn-helix domain-containing protein [Listeria booriae]MBC2324573.1 helix-turn-helix transcriptional regulator [Listeria booriae]
MNTIEENNYINSLTDKCPIRYTLNSLGGKWKLLIIWELYTNEVMRFNELKRSLTGITNTMLAKSLEELEVEDFIQRKQYNTMPLRVEYRLSDRTETLIPILEALVSWGNTQLEQKAE